MPVERRLVPTLTVFLLDLLTESGDLVLQRLEWCGQHPLDHVLDEFLDIFPLHISFDIDPITGLPLMQCGNGVGVGNNGAGKCRGLTIKNR